MEIHPDLSTLQGTTRVTLPGCKDKEDRPIILVTVPQEASIVDIVSPLQYLLSIFSPSTKSRGFTTIVDARKSVWKTARLCIRQVKATYSRDELQQLIVIKPDAFWDKQRVENCTSSQDDQQVIFIPRSRLNKYVDQSQLPVELGGNFICDHEKWIESRQRVEEFYKDAEVTMKELDELHRHVIRSKMLRASQVEDAINTSCDMAESTKMLVHNSTEMGKELVQNIEYENRTRKFSIEDLSKIYTPQDTLDTIEKIHQIVNDIRKKQQEIESAWLAMERSLVDTKDLCQLEEGIAKVTSWILGPAEQMLKSNQAVGYDVASAEELRREHETIELRCWEAYGNYAEILYKINLVSKSHDEPNPQLKDIISQKDFMDFVCRSFASRLERRRNILITSLRFFRLVAEYFDKTGDVFDSLVMGSDVNDFENAARKLKELQESQSCLDNIEEDLRKQGEKLSDMLSMPVKDALGQEISIDYSEDIGNIRDILDATVARKNIFSDSVELQKLSLQQVTFIDTYEKDAQQAVKWLGDILTVILRDHGHVGSTVYEIQLQKEEHQIFQETAKDAYNYGCQLLSASLLLRQSCKLPLAPHNALCQNLRNFWEAILHISQEQMTRLRVSAVFHRSIEDHCNQLRDMREAVATIPLMALTKKRSRVNYYFGAREKLMVEVGRMVRLGRLLRSRLKESLYQEESFSKLDENLHQLSLDAIKNNEIANEAISERLSEVTQLSEELDQALKSAQQDCIVFSTASTSTNSSFSEINNNIPCSSPKEMENHPSTSEKLNKTDDQLRSDEEFQTASDGTLQHSRSSSYNTASECEQRYSPWWQYGKDDMRDNIVKEKMVLGVGLPELPPIKDVLKPSPEVPPGKIAREVTETTHIKVQQQHTLGVKSFVLTSETVRDKNAEGETTREKSIRFRGTDGTEVVLDGRGKSEIDAEDLMKRLREVGVLEQDAAWQNYGEVTKRTIKNLL